MNENLVPSLKIMLAMIIVGSSVIVGKLIVQSFPVFLGAELRFLIATIILVPLMIILEGFPSISKQDLLILFLQAFFGVFLFNIFMLYGLTITTAMEGGIITSTAPAITGAIAFLFLKEKLGKNVILAISLAIFGTLIINFTESISTVGNSSLIGNLLIFCSVICESLFIIFGKFVAERVSPLAISTIVSIFGAVLFLPFSLYEGSQFNFGEVSVLEWGLVFYSGIVVTVIAFILMYQGVSKIPASTVGVLTCVLPISSVILSIVILGEKMTFTHLIGICLILIAIYLIARPEKQNNLRN
ncbi:DMT family transporter [Lysinibacillus telephonicus]|uniref:DMT family transporter n=1 Tax=Lysinibacillus telephonicus TaxID=1714840 RepID=A0A431UVA5_9BACI|nr:DMT family transporter [Lysinibacillus telephonicus]RTQ94901.1 DMT family transporter [Lysinibacillus telephonicus]